MKNKGFTLMELLATIIIVSIVTGLVVPTVINQLAGKKHDIDDTTKKMIYEAADLYMSNNISNYPKLAGNSYCISLEQLVNSEYLVTPLKDYSSGKEIPLTKKVSITVNAKKEYDSFKLVDNC